MDNIDEYNPDYDLYQPCNWSTPVPSETDLAKYGDVSVPWGTIRRPSRAD